MNAKSTARALIVGEVLWDCFPERRVLGGAPFNVAWNLAGFGNDPIMVSAVGDDEMGREILARMRGWGLSTDKIAVLSNRPTGTVQVTLDKGEPSYDITADVAWDAIPEPSVESNDVAYLYHGSLAWRCERSRQTILHLREQLSVGVFVDINVREPHFDLQWMQPMLHRAQCVKLNADELARITERELGSDAARRDAARKLLEEYEVQQLLVTLGASGAERFTSTGEYLFVDAPKPASWVDAVGAGDAFASVVLHGQLLNRDPEATLQDAVAFAADVCGLSGATTEARSFYQRSFCL